MWPLRFILICFFIVGCKPVVDQPEQATQSLQQEDYKLITSSGEHSLTLELAKTAQQQRIGLMFRRSLAMDHGMLFTYATPANISFWMKNTYIPLDMVFLNKGVVVDFHKNAQPHDLTSIQSKQLADAAIELAAGAIDYYKIRKGDRLLADR